MRPPCDDDRAACDLRVTTVATDESLARVVNLLRRTRWRIHELHLRGRCDCNEVELRATKPGGRPEVLVAALRREVVVLDVESRPAVAPG